MKQAILIASLFSAIALGTCLLILASLNLNRVVEQQTKKISKLPTLLADTVGIDSNGMIHLKFNIGLCFEHKNGVMTTTECEVK